MNWAIGISLLFSIFSIPTLFRNPSSFNSWVPAVLNALTFAFILRVRFKFEVKAATFALIAFAANFLYYFVTFLIALPKTMALLKSISQARNNSYYVLFFSTFLGYGVFLLCGYLYYKVYKATRIIETLNNESQDDQEPCN